MQTQGYMIVLQPKALIKMYDELPASQYETHEIRTLRAALVPRIREFREAFAAFNPTRYRGISRDCLFAYPSLNSKEIEKFQAECYWPNPLGKADARARYRFREIIGRPVDEYNALSGRSYDVLDDLADAMELYFLLDDPSQWEIIHVSRADSLYTETTLGYDIGHWNALHFSLIGDIVAIPFWFHTFHTPPREDYAELNQELSRLNEHLLFASINDADSFRSYYKSKSWAEEECAGEEFDIIRVDAVAVNH
jgi:hypothetical protein